MSWLRPQPKRVAKVYLVPATEAISIESTGQADRIHLREPSARWIVVPVPLVLHATAIGCLTQQRAHPVPGRKRHVQRMPSRRRHTHRGPRYVAALRD